jgi:hypothetical protein
LRPWLANGSDEVNSTPIQYFNVWRTQLRTDAVPKLP